MGMNVEFIGVEALFFYKKLLNCYTMSDYILINVNKVFRMGLQYYANEECLSCSKGVINGKKVI